MFYGRGSDNHNIALHKVRVAALQVEVQHFLEKMLHGKNVSTTEF